MSGAHESGFVKGKRVFPQKRFTKGLNPFGLGILYSAEFSFKPYGEATRHFAYAGITGQVDPNERFDTHFEGSKSIYEDLKGNKKVSLKGKKGLYVALGASFLSNENMMQGRLRPDIIKIVNVVSLFDLGAMEKKMILDKKTLNTEIDKIENYEDFIKGNNLSKNAQGKYGLNSVTGGEGAMEKQAVQLSPYEWLFAAYYYIIETDAYIKASRGTPPYETDDSFEDKIFKLINQYQNLASSEKIKYKIPAISKESISEFVQQMGLAEKDVRLKKGLVNMNEIFKFNPVVLEIETINQNTEGKNIKMSSRKDRNSFLDLLASMKKSNSKTTFEEIMKIKTKILETGAIPKVEATKINKEAVKRTTNLLDTLIKNAKFLEEVSREGVSAGVIKLLDTLKDTYPSFRPSSRFIQSFSNNAYKDEKVRQFLIKEIIKILIEEIASGAAAYSGKTIGDQLAANAKEDLGKMLNINEPFTVQFTRDTKPTDIGKIVNKQLKDRQNSTTEKLNKR